MNNQIQKNSNPLVPKNRNRYRIRRFLLFPFGILLIIWILSIVITRAYSLEEVVVEGSTHYTADEIRDYLVTSKSDQITFMMYVRYKFGEHVQIPFVETYQISMKDRHTVLVKVYEKMLVGCVKLLDSYMYFDRDGIIVESCKERIEGVPLITGLQFDKIVLHEKLEIQQDSLYEMMLNLTKTIQKFDLSVDKVFINSNYEVSLQIGENEVLLGKRDFYDMQLEALVSIMESSNDMKLSYDMRFYDENNKKITAKPLE